MLKNVVEVELQVTSNFIEWVFVTFENLDCHHIYDTLSAEFSLQVLFSKKNVFYLRKEMEIYIIFFNLSDHLYPFIRAPGKLHDVGI